VVARHGVELRTHDAVVGGLAVNVLDGVLELLFGLKDRREDALRQGLRLWNVVDGKGLEEQRRKGGGGKGRAGKGKVGAGKQKKKQIRAQIRK